MPILSHYVYNETSLPNTNVTSQKTVMGKLKELQDKGVLGKTEPFRYCREATFLKYQEHDRLSKTLAIIALFDFQK